MKFADVAARLRFLPSPLPPAPGALDPVVVGRPDEVAPWVRQALALPPREAAVLVLLYPGPDAEAYLVLTVRPTGDLRHSGQISFPGGAREPGDSYPAGTALREAAEEVNLDPGAAGVEVLGTLDPVDMRRISGFLVLPVLVIAAREPVLQAHEREVAAILRVPARHFLADAAITIVETDRDGWRMRYGEYRFGEHGIWGATARILGQLGAVLSGDGSRGHAPEAVMRDTDAD